MALSRPPSVSISGVVRKTKGPSTAAGKLSPLLQQQQRPSALRCRVPKAPTRSAILSSTSRLGKIEASAAPAAAERKPDRVERKTKGIPVYVMLPLDTVRPGGGLNRRKALKAGLMALKAAGVEGVMADVWWGLVERDRPGEYDWNGYAELLDMIRSSGLKLQAVMSFHQCGGNVGDCCTIPLPIWVEEEMDKDPDLAYTDQWGRRSHEYLSLGCDTLPVLRGRSPLQCYADFMTSFRERFRELIGSTIVQEIQVGMGPAGELRYPSYPEQHGTWRFPGIGAFQCFDKHMLAELKAAAEAVGRKDWGNGAPTDAGGYNSWPEETDFFRRDGGWCSDYGVFFLSWYSGMLLEHGDRVLSLAVDVFRREISFGVKVSVKVAGVHWHYGTRSHAAELTAGYYNTRDRDGYLPVAEMLARHGAVFNFTCLEMEDREHPWEAQCRPEALVRQVAAAAGKAGVELAGENALPVYGDGAHQQIVRAATELRRGGGPVSAFTYLRMSPALFEGDRWRRFVAFVRRMKGIERCPEEVEREAAPAAAPPVFAAV